MEERYGTSKKEFIFRLGGLCPGGGRKRRRAGEYLEVPLSGGKGRGRAVPGGLPDIGADIRVHASGHGGGDRQEDQAEPADGLREAAAQVGILGRGGLPGARHHPAVLLRDRRLGNPVFPGLPHRGGHAGGPGRVFYGFHHQPVLPHRDAGNLPGSGIRDHHPRGEQGD